MTKKRSKKEKDDQSEARKALQNVAERRATRQQEEKMKMAEQRRAPIEDNVIKRENAKYCQDKFGAISKMNPSEREDVERQIKDMKQAGLKGKTLLQEMQDRIKESEAQQLKVFIRKNPAGLNNIVDNGGWEENHGGDYEEDVAALEK